MDGTARSGRRHPRRLAKVVGASVLMGLGVAAAVGAHPPRARADSLFTATSNASLVNQVVAVEPPILQANLLDPGADVAQAQLTSYGQSTAFASNPYPGSLVVGAPGEIDGLLGTEPGVPPQITQAVGLIPDYPLVASSSYPSTPSDSEGVGPVRLLASSGALQSSGTSSDGLDQSTATVSEDPTTGQVVASAVATIASVNLGSAVSISGIRSSATATALPDGTVTKKATFSIADLTILGQHLVWSDGSLQLLGYQGPGLGQEALLVNQLLQAASATGITIHVLPASSTQDGITSAGLQVTRVIDTNVNGMTVSTTATFGQESASVTNTALPPPSSTLFPGSFTTTSSGTGSPSAPVPFVPSGQTSLPSSVPGGAPGGSRALNGEVSRTLLPELVQGRDFYVFLIMIGVVIAVATSLLRRLGVKATWIS
jgi:hypothetical protein